MGLLAAKTLPLRDAMLPSAQACIRAIEEQLPALLRRRASALHEQMKAAQQQSLAPVTTTAEHAKYLVTLRDLGPYLPRISRVSPLYLPRVSPISPLYLPYISLTR